jgi:hypothetical protein
MLEHVDGDHDAIRLWRDGSGVEKMLFMCLVGYALTTTRERVNQLIWAVALTIGIGGSKAQFGASFTAVAESTGQTAGCCRTTMISASA